MENEFVLVVGCLKTKTILHTRFNVNLKMIINRSYEKIGSKESDQKTGAGYCVLIGETNNYRDYVIKECIYKLIIQKTPLYERKP